MKIIHCSDLHLDSRMESNLTSEQAVERNNEIFLTFKRLISYAKENDVKVIMIVGDMFDERRVSERIVELVKGAIYEAEDIDFLYLRGNHDENSDVLCKLKQLNNVKLFSDKWIYYQYGDVTIGSVELDRNNCEVIYDELSLDAASTNIVMLHGQESAQAGEDLVCLNKLKSKHIKYLALGHLHSYKKEALDLNGEYCYCGCLEGRGFDECGEKGFVLLNVEGKEIKTSFVPFSKRVLHDIHIDITGLRTVNELLTAIEEGTSQLPETDLVKVTLVGTYTTDTNKDIDFLKASLAGRFYFLKIKDESRLLIDSKDYQYDKSLKGEFVRMVLDADISNKDKERIIDCGLAALKGERISL